MIYFTYLCYFSDFVLNLEIEARYIMGFYDIFSAQNPYHCPELLFLPKIWV